jgi:Zn-dependent protease
MLFLLRSPWLLLGCAVGLLVGIVLRGVVQAYAGRSLLRDRSAFALGRHQPDPRRHVDVFGVVVALLTDPPVAWGRPLPFPEPRFGGRGRYVVVAMAGPAAQLLLGLALLAGYALAGGPELGLTLALGGAGQVVADEVPITQQLLLGAGVSNLATAVLHLVPLPPLDASRVLFVLAPRSEGWQRARYWLEEQNVGLALCVVLLIPIFGGRGLLLRVVTSFADVLSGVVSPLF